MAREKAFSMTGVCVGVMLACACCWAYDADFGDGWTCDALGRQEKVDLPHDFLINAPWSQAACAGRGFKATAEGVYRKSFRADPSWKGKRVFLDFEGVQYFCDVFANGHKVASWEYGYLGFEADLSAFLDYEGENAVEVRCSTGPDSGARWYTGAGICRRVFLRVRESPSFARHGLFVLTPRVEADSASVRLVADVIGWSAETNGELRIVGDVHSPSGETVATVERRIGPDRRTCAEFEMPIVKIDSPALWSPESPSLYRAAVRLFRGETELDRVERRFGVRKVEYSPDFGFRLNGCKVFLKGMSNHQDLGALGVASFPRAWKRQIEVMKEFGYNAIRCSHNPYPQELLDLCDEMGILVVDEIVDQWKGFWGGRKPYAALAPELIREWVRRDRSHPSVILWSLGNETQFEWNLPFGASDWGVTEYRVFDALVKRWDVSRPTTVALFPARAGGLKRRDPGFCERVEPPELSRVTEVAAFNYLPESYPDYRRSVPDLCIFQSEASVHDGAYPFFVMDRATTVGLSYWGAIPYWGESDGWPKKGWNYSFFEHTLEPLPQAYLIRSAFRDADEEPVVRIGVQAGRTDHIVWNDIESGRLNLVSHWNFPEGSDHDVRVYSNGDEVELLLNGRTLGVRRNPFDDLRMRNTFCFGRIAYKPGSLVAVARRGGREIARHELKTAGRAVRLELVAENATDWSADGYDLQYVWVEAKDAFGLVDPTACESVSFLVEGPAKMQAVDDGDHYTDQLFNVRAKCLRNGKLLVILRAAHTPGEVRLTASSQKLGERVLAIRTVGGKERASR